MKNKKIVVVLLLLFIIAIFGWIGYTLFFPKSSSTPIRSRSFYPQTFNVESVLAKKISTDYVKSIEIKSDIFSPLVVNLNKEDLISLLKTSNMNVKFNPNLRYLSGVKSHGVNMVTFLLNGKSVTFDFDKSNTHFSWNKSEYVLVYFDPTYEGAVIMNILNGQLYTVTSQGLMIK